MSDNRPSVYTDGNLVVYRASALGSCTRALAAIRSGHEPVAPFPARFRKTLDDGNRGEAVILQGVADAGYTIGGGQQDEIELIVGTTADAKTIVVRGHVDDIVVDSVGSFRVVDAKTTSAKYGVSDDLAERYNWQIAVYMHALGMPGMFAYGIKDPDTGDVVDVEIELVDTPPHTMGQIKARIAKIEYMAQGRRYLDVECSVKNKYPCPVYHLSGHGKADDGEADPYQLGGAVAVTVGPVLEDDSLDRYCQMYVDAQQREAAAKDDKANARKMIVNHVGGEGEERTTDLFDVGWSGTGMQKVLLTKELERYLASLGPGAPKLESFYGTQSKAKSINVKERG